MSAKRTYITFIFDRSGSMERISRQAVAGYNNQIEAIREDENFVNGDTQVSLYFFASKPEGVFFNESLNALVGLEEKDYKPLGATALRDTVSEVLDRLERETNTKDPENAYLVVIISDGKDTCSKIKSGDLSRRISRLQEEGKSGRAAGFTFTYLGTNHRLEDIRDFLPVPVGNFAFFDSRRGDDVKSAFASNSVQLKRYAKQRQNSTQVADFYEGSQLKNEGSEADKSRSNVWNRPHQT